MSSSSDKGKKPTGYRVKQSIKIALKPIVNYALAAQYGVTWISGKNVHETKNQKNAYCYCGRCYEEVLGEKRRIIKHYKF